MLLIINQSTSTSRQVKTLESLVKKISPCEQVISQWDNNHLLIVERLKSAVKKLYKERLTRLVSSLKQELIGILPHAVEDKIVYGLLRYHQLINSPNSAFKRTFSTSIRNYSSRIERS
ncbi:MAG: hypothetical protein ACTMUB_07255 [cyanobacterium endosymbiont of Rhopalodia musculus]